MRHGRWRMCWPAATWPLCSKISFGQLPRARPFPADRRPGGLFTASLSRPRGPLPIRSQNRTSEGRRVQAMISAQPPDLHFQVG
jgi:hypothetical protein